MRVHGVLLADGYEPQLPRFPRIDHSGESRETLGTSNPAAYDQERERPPHRAIAPLPSGKVLRVPWTTRISGWHLSDGRARKKVVLRRSSSGIYTCLDSSIHRIVQTLFSHYS